VMPFLFYRMLSVEQNDKKQIEDGRAFTFLLDKIKRNRNIDFSQYRHELLRRRIDHRIYSAGCENYWDYILLLNRDIEEYDRLIDMLTIKETYFFRDTDVFDTLGNGIIPEIVSKKEAAGSGMIRAWSCGAAFGEEAYSIAILFNETLGNRIEDFDINITATDISKEALDRAPWGSYDKRALGKIKPHLLFKYFTLVKDRYVINDKAKKLVTFRHHDIVSGGPLKGMDLILCRNLLIYFEKELQEKVFHNLQEALNPGGFLVLGMTESIAPQMKEHFEAVDIAERIYIRK